jgi:DNA polymerase-3 subunit delta'
VQITEADRVDGSLKIEQIRTLRQGLSMRAYEARYKVAIIRRFHEAQAAASNALLKTLEEPPANVVIILTAEDADVLLPTIRSRCQHVPLHPLPMEQIREALETRWKLPWQDAQLLAHLSGGRLGWALRVLEDEAFLSQRNEQVNLLEDLLLQNRKGRFGAAEKLAKDKTELLDLLQVWQIYWRDAFLVSSGSAEWVTNIDREASLTALADGCTPESIQMALTATRRTINYLRRNVNTRLAVEAMVLDYPTLPAADRA